MSRCERYDEKAFELTLYGFWKAFCIRESLVISERGISFQSTRPDHDQVAFDEHVNTFSDLFSRSKRVRGRMALLLRFWRILGPRLMENDYPGPLSPWTPCTILWL